MYCCNSQIFFVALRKLLFLNRSTKCVITQEFCVCVCLKIESKMTINKKSPDKNCNISRF